MPYTGERWWEKTLANSVILDYLEEKILVNSPFQINTEIKEIEGEKFGNWLSICQIHQCFLLPTFSAIQYMNDYVVNDS